MNVEMWSAKVHRDENTQNIREKLPKKLFGAGGMPKLKWFYDLSIPEQTYYLLYLNGCRVPYKSMIGNTEEWMRLRAGETNSFFKWITTRAESLNKKLYGELVTPQRRLISEPMPKGKYEPHTGPRDNAEFIYPMQGIYGYAPSRVFIEIMGRRGKRTISGFINATKVLDSALEISETRSEMLARLVNGGFHNGANPIDMLSHVFPIGILEEQNCFTDYQAITADLKIHAPQVWKYYEDCDKSVLVQNGIAEKSSFIRDHV